MLNWSPVFFQNTNKPTQMALEPIHNQKAAVVSLFIQLPGGDEDFTPAGTSGLAIGSALISIGKYRSDPLVGKYKYVFENISSNTLHRII